MTPAQIKGIGRLVAIVLLGIGLATAAGVVIYRVFFAPAEAARVAKQAEADTGAAKVQAESAKDGIATGDRIIERNSRIERITHENTIRITAAVGAGDPVPPAVTVELDRALGMRDAYQPEDAATR